MKQYSTLALKQYHTVLCMVKRGHSELPAELKPLFNRKSIDSTLESIEAELKKRAEAELSNIKNHTVAYKKVQCDI